MKLDRSKAVLVIVDLQERLLPAIDQAEDVLERAAFLVRVAERLDVPILVTEQYPAGLGQTVEALSALLPQTAEIVEKMTFDAMGEAAMRDAVARHGLAGRTEVVVIGTEAHVCLLQTAFGLQAHGYRVIVAADATGSRRPFDCDLALDRLQRAGVEIASSEMVAFEWLERAGTPEFRSLLEVIK